MLQANIMASGTNWDLVAELGWDVALLQETRAAPDAEAVKDVRRRRWALCRGEPQDDGEDLVWLIARRGALTPISTPLGPRVVAAVWSPGGPVSFRLYGIYGDASGTPAAHAETNEFIRWCLQDAEAAGQVPALIAGDINADWGALQVAPELVVSGWADLGDAPTCAPGNARRASRIDVLLANRQCQVRAGRPVVDWATGIPTHAVQLVDLTAGPSPVVEKWVHVAAPCPKAPLCRPPRLGPSVWMRDAASTWRWREVMWTRLSLR